SNHLDMEAIEVMTEEVSRFQGGVVIVTHDEGILRSLATKLIIFHEKRVVLYDGTYDNFLETTGWEEEGLEKAPKPKKKSSKKSRKNRTKEHDPLKEDKRRLKVLTKEYEEVEYDLKNLESELEIKNNEVQKLVSNGGEGVKIAGLYKDIAGTQSKIDQQYKKMEALLTEIDGLKTGT
ncbi:MAG: hypothetical protein ACE5DR_06115, partial [Thermodesulfobacteriota bacterium]